MKTTTRSKSGRHLLTATIAAVILLSATSANAWWGWGRAWPLTGAWDPTEAYLYEYGFLDPYGPTTGDVRRMHRDNWRAMLGYPIRRDGVGPYGPRLSDIRRQQYRKARRFRGYPY